MITPYEIQNKVFTKSMRGYKEEEVDLYLDSITETIEDLLQQNKNLQKRIIDLESDIERKNRTEVCLADTLDTAKALMADISERSEKRAQLVLENAEIEAEKIIRQAREEAEKYKTDVYKIKNNISVFNRKYKSLLESEIEKFDCMIDEIDSEDEAIN